MGGRRERTGPPAHHRTIIGRLLVAATAVAGVLAVSGALSRDAQGEGLESLFGPITGCFETRSFGVGLIGDGAGTIDVPAGEGVIAAAFLEWAGADDTTPDDPALPDGRADSTLTVNGVAVAGTQSTSAGSGGSILGHGPEAQAFGFVGGWYGWHADVGPSGAGIVSGSGAQTLTISGWDRPTGVPDGRNGATLTVVYESSPCEVERRVEVFTGLDVYWWGLPAAGFDVESWHTGVFEFVFPAAGHDRIAKLAFTHAGTDASSTSCRGKAVWMKAGSGPSPVSSGQQLVSRSGTGGGFGVNGGVEIIDDPFPTAGCDTVLNPAPDVPYAPGHPFPSGAAPGGAPYRAVEIESATNAAEWAVVEVDVAIPAGATWAAFQLESEADQNGESGAWGGGLAFVMAEPVSVGDLVWLDADRDCLQDGGEPGVAGVSVTLHDASTGNPVQTPAGPAAMVTDAAGAYLFDGLPPGDYTVHFDPASLPAGHGFTCQGQGDALNGSDADPTTGASTPTGPLAEGMAYLGLDAGLIASVDVGDLVWRDLDGNCRQDAGEPGVSGVGVALLDGAGAPVDLGAGALVTTTGADGSYLFSDLPPGTYAVRFDLASLPSNTTLTCADGPADSGSDADPITGVTPSVAVGAGEGTRTLDAGIVDTPTPPAAQVGPLVVVCDGEFSSGPVTVRARVAMPSGMAATVLANGGAVETVTAGPAGLDRRYQIDPAEPVTFSVQFPGSTSLTPPAPVAFAGNSCLRLAFTGVSNRNLSLLAVGTQLVSLGLAGVVVSRRLERAC